MAENNQILKLVIKGDFPSLAGFADKSYKQGSTATIVTMGNFLSLDELNDPFVFSIKSQIGTIMSEWIFPRLLKHFSNKLPEKFVLQTVRIELFGNESENTIYFNKEAKIKAMCKYVGNKKLTPNEPVLGSDIEKIINLYCDERDPNAACLMFINFRGNWMGIIDYTYNRKNASEKYRLAQTHLNAALSNYEKSNLEPFYTSLWDGCELLVESILLLHNQLKLKETHKKISKLLEGFCEIRNMVFHRDFSDIRKIRDVLRYGPPHTTNIDYKDKSLTYLSKAKEFSEFVETFLKERAVNLSNSPSIHSLQLDQIKNNE